MAKKNKTSKGKVEESMSSAESEVSRGDHSPVADDIMSPKQTDSQETVETRGGTPVNLSNLYPKCGDSSPVDEDKAMNTSSKTSPHPLIEDRGHPERKRRASNDSCESSTRTSEGGTIDEQAGKEDEEDEENDDDEKMPIGKEYDPERLKAFNMFCRLFVDENLDRMVPISKQPKDKIQAILDACDRQFPEFHIRSRKRIRTYLKSCRRMRRTKEQNGWEPLRPTPPHLTSAAAEGLLAQACENESHNAKRMRMGLDPLPVRFKHANAMRSIDSSHTLNSQQMTPTPTPVQSPPQTPASISSPPQQQQQPQQQQPQQQQQQQQQTSDVQQTPQAHTNTQQPITPADRHVPANNDFVHHQPPPPSFRPPPEFHPPFFPNGNGLFRPGFPPGYQHPAHHHPPVLQHSPIQPTSIQNGPTDLSMKKQNSKNQLSSSEIATIKQLIAGYRESAAFLYRSADELEQLLLQQN